MKPEQKAKEGFELAVYTVLLYAALVIVGVFALINDLPIIGVPVLVTTFILMITDWDTWRYLFRRGRY